MAKSVCSVIERKMDLVVDFLKQQFILEMKLWYGDKRHEEAYDQLAKKNGRLSFYDSRPTL